MKQGHTDKERERNLRDMEAELDLIDTRVKKINADRDEQINEEKKILEEEKKRYQDELLSKNLQLEELRKVQNVSFYRLIEILGAFVKDVNDLKEQDKSNMRIIKEQKSAFANLNAELTVVKRKLKEKEGDFKEFQTLKTSTDQTVITDIERKNFEFKIKELDKCQMKLLELESKNVKLEKQIKKTEKKTLINLTIY